MFRHVLFAPLFIAAGVAFSAGAAENLFSKSLTIGTDTVSVRLKIRTVDPSKESVPVNAPGSNVGAATSRIASLTVIWGTKKIDVPPSLYTDIFSPAIQARLGWWDESEGISLIPSSDGRALLIQMLATSSACCGYSVWWKVNRDGSVERFVDASSP